MDFVFKIVFVKEFQKFEDDDDNRSILMIGSDLDEDSSVIQDDLLKMKCKKMVFKII